VANDSANITSTTSVKKPAVAASSKSLISWRTSLRASSHA
jgi:hypothetical protein